MVSGPDSIIARGVYVATPDTSNKTAVDYRQDQLGKLTQLAVGQEMKGQVLSLLNDGNTLIRFPEATLRIPLPLGFQPGQAVTVQVVRAGVDPAFRVVAENLSAQPTLSPFGKGLSTFLLQAETTITKPGILTTQPIFGDIAGTSPTARAEQLMQAVTLSGVFYESHLTQWAHGQRSHEMLQQEPQAGFASRDILQVATHETDGKNTKPQALAAQQEVDTLTQLVATQMQMLESPQMKWQGPVWPGQHLEWDISKEKERAMPPSEDSDTTAWTTSLKLDLPHVGNVVVEVKLFNNQLAIAVKGGNDTTVELLQEHQLRLSQALQAVGLPNPLIGFARNG